MGDGRAARDLSFHALEVTSHDDFIGFQRPCSWQNSGCRTMSDRWKGGYRMIPGRKQEVEGEAREVLIALEGTTLEGTLVVPTEAVGLVLFAHGSGSSRHSPRNRFVAQVLHSQHIGTLLFDLLTRQEESVDQYTSQLRFDIPFLAQRLVGATRWSMNCVATHELKIGYFGASTGAGAALVAAAELCGVISAIVSRGGRPDLAGSALALVYAPTLLIVGGDDGPVIAMNREALARLKCPEKELVVIPGASHLFEEPGTLERAADAAADWFSRYFVPVERASAGNGRP
jgi:putative phosphoribosyl transferase